MSKQLIAENQAQRLLEYLVVHKTIEPLTSWKTLGIYRLAAVIHILRKAGWSITTTRIHVENIFGETCSVALYTLQTQK